MAIDPTDVHDDVDLARRVLAYARPVAPCLQSLEGEPREEALSILKAVASRVQTAQHGLKAVGDWSFFSDVEMGGYFGVNDQEALRALCGRPPSSGRGPAYSFPEPDEALRRVWR